MKPFAQAGSRPRGRAAGGGAETTASFPIERRRRESPQAASTAQKFGICRTIAIGRECPYAKCDATLQAKGPPPSAPAVDALGGEKAPPPSPDAAADGSAAEDMT